jgi:HEAT repeat protein
MSRSRAAGLLITLVLFAVVAVAQQPPAKTPPAKPGDPKTDPKAKNPMPKPPPSKSNNIDWPKEINGRNLKDTIKDIRGHADPAVREASIRTLPFFGPESRKLGADELVEAMTKDNDWNVRIAAISVAPTVLIGFATEPPDPQASSMIAGLNAIATLLTNPEALVRLEAVAAAAACGPYFRTVKSDIIQRLATRARDTASWQMRRAAVAAIGRVGSGLQTDPDPDKKDPPDTAAVGVLLDILRSDPSATVRREVVNSLLGMGPVATKDHKNWRSVLDGVLAKGFEKDKAVLLWVHVLILRNDPKGLEGNEAHLDAVAKLLTATEPGGRLEACQALGFLGEVASSKLQGLVDIINKETVPEVIAAAIVAVTAMPKESAIILPVLRNVEATHMNQDVRKLATEAIKAITTAKKN